MASHSGDASKSVIQTLLYSHLECTNDSIFIGLRRAKIDEVVNILAPHVAAYPEHFIINDAQTFGSAVVRLESRMLAELEPECVGLVLTYIDSIRTNSTSVSVVSDPKKSFICRVFHPSSSASMACDTKTVTDDYVIATIGSLVVDIHASLLGTFTYSLESTMVVYIIDRSEIVKAIDQIFGDGDV